MIGRITKQISNSLAHETNVVVNLKNISVQRGENLEI